MHVAINERLIGDVEVLTRNNGGVIDAGVVDGQERQFPFSAVPDSTIRRVEADSHSEIIDTIRQTQEPDKKYPNSRV